MLIQITIHVVALMCDNMNCNFFHYSAPIDVFSLD